MAITGADALSQSPPVDLAAIYGYWRSENRPSDCQERLTHYTELRYKLYGYPESFRVAYQAPLVTDIPARYRIADGFIFINAGEAGGQTYSAVNIVDHETIEFHDVVGPDGNPIDIRSPPPFDSVTVGEALFRLKRCGEEAVEFVASLDRVWSALEGLEAETRSLMNQDQGADTLYQLAWASGVNLRCTILKGNALEEGTESAHLFNVAQATTENLRRRYDKKTFNTIMRIAYDDSKKRECDSFMIRHSFEKIWKCRIISIFYGLVSPGCRGLL
jgi:hypothetical protein